MNIDNSKVTIFQRNHPQVLIASTTSILLTENAITITIKIRKMLRVKK